MQLLAKLNGLYHLIRLSRYYGPLIPFTRTGRLKVYDYSFPLYCRPSQEYLWLQARGECYEPATCQHMINRYRNRKITFLDIGAFYGFFSSLIGTLNPENRIYAFEPSPLNCKALEKNLKMNCRYGEIYHMALSDSRGTVPFKDRSMKVSASETTLRVPTMTFQEWQREHPVKPDVVKIDVHGSEGMVLFGMQNLLKEGGFDIYFELHRQEMLAKYTIKEIFTLLYDSGWKISELVDFRGSGAPEPVPVDANRRSILEDPLKWEKENLGTDLMFFCNKPGSE